jgi:hypothetical protein
MGKVYNLCKELIETDISIVIIVRRGLVFLFD